MIKHAIIKPDHLGDLVLASPAIRAISNHADTIVYVAGSSLELARFLFPETEVVRFDFTHLARRPTFPSDIRSFATELSRFDRVFILRDDDVLQDFAAMIKADVVIAIADQLNHDTVIHKRALASHLPAYSRSELFSPALIFWPQTVRRLGLCIGAGFPANLWPLNHWYQLALGVVEQGIELCLIGGPLEHKALLMLSATLGTTPHRLIEGTSRFDEFLGAIDDIDLIVGGDGGTMHICSLRKPTISLFGGAPWRRYAPFGFANVVLTRDLVCSPCLQFSTAAVNGCLTRECMNRIAPKDVLRAIVSGGLDFTAVLNTKVFRGVSHSTS